MSEHWCSRNYKLKYQIEVGTFVLTKVNKDNIGLCKKQGK